MRAFEDETIRIERLELGPFRTNAYILICQKTKQSMLVDAPADYSRILQELNKTDLRYILITHSHADHTGALMELKSAVAAPLAAHPADAEQMPAAPDILLNDGDIVCAGRLEFQVLHTPGHTPGSLCFLCPPHLLSGDTIFPGGPGKTMSPRDFREVIRSIEKKIFILPGETVIYPGHGEFTTVGKERAAYAACSSRLRDHELYGDVVWDLLAG